MKNRVEQLMTEQEIRYGDVLKGLSDRGIKMNYWKLCRIRRNEQQPSMDETIIFMDIFKIKNIKKFTYESNDDSGKD